MYTNLKEQQLNKKYKSFMNLSFCLYKNIIFVSLE